MTAKAKAVLDAAMELSEDERGLLAEKLLESLPSDLEEVSEDELAAELERRWAEFEKDPSIAIPWEQVNKRS